MAIDARKRQRQQERRLAKRKEKQHHLVHQKDMELDRRMESASLARFSTAW